MAQRIEVVEDPEYTARYPQDYWIEMLVTGTDGATKRFFSECPSGDPEAPQYRKDAGLLHAEVEAKCASLLDECGFGARAKALSAACNSLADAPDVHALAAILGSKH